MDRYDEKKARMDEVGTGREEVHDRDLVRDGRIAEDRDTPRESDAEPVREGDVLGLSDMVVPKGPADPSTEYDPQSVARRRGRALGEEEESVSEPADPSNQGGATGIDMGSGGQSTLLRRPKSS